MRSASVRSRRGDPRGGARREWLVTDGLRRLRDGHGRRPAHPPLPRPARGRDGAAGRPSCRASPALDPVAGPRRPARAARRARVGWRRRRPAPATSTWRRSRSTACRAGAGRSATSCSSAEMAMPRPAGGRRRPPARARRRAGARSSSPPLCTWRDAHGERHAAGAPAVEPARPTGSSSRAPTASQGPGCGAGAASGTAGAHLREEAARGLRRPRTCGRRQRSRPSCSRARRRTVVAWAGGVEVPAAARIVDAARQRCRAPVAAPPARRRGRRAAGHGRRSVHRRRTHRRRRLSVVRRVVAGHDDVVRGPVPGDRAGRRGPRRCCSRAAAAVRGHAGQHRRPAYNTVDATLWFAHAVGRHVEREGDDSIAALLDQRLARGEKLGARPFGEGIGSCVREDLVGAS